MTMVAVPPALSVTASPPVRSRYIDTLRAVAMVRVFLHHALWVGWLTVLFPSMWVMFALGGCLMAASLQRGGIARTVWSRLRRLLPPLWVLAAVAIPFMLLTGWLSDPVSPFRWSDVLWWILPVTNPPASSAGGPFVMALWYIRAYLWFVALSPVLWWLYRRWPVPTLAAPLALAVVCYSPLVMLPDNPVGDVVWTTLAFGTCWVAGFARHTGLLYRLPVRFYLAVGTILCLTGLGWGLVAATDPAAPWAFADPLAETLWGTGFVLVLIRLRPTMAWLDRVTPLSRFLTAINARAVTIYVWHVPVLFGTVALLAACGVQTGTSWGLAASTLLAVALVALVVVAVGWVEDLAAGRRPAVVPGLGRRAPRPRAGHDAAGALRGFPGRAVSGLGRQPRRLW